MTAKRKGYNKVTKKELASSFFYSLSSASLALRFSLYISIRLPNNQYGITKVSKKIINQNPMVNIVKKAKNPKYWSNSNMISYFVATKIV